MLLREKGAKKDAEPVSMGWDEAQAALAAGTHEAVNTGDGERPDTAEDDGLDEMNRADLDKLAAERGVDITQAKTKADVIAALRAARG